MSRKNNNRDSGSCENSELFRTDPSTLQLNNNEYETEQQVGELLEQADAVDRVMTKNGAPEDDWTSG